MCIQRFEYILNKKETLHILDKIPYLIIMQTLKSMYTVIMLSLCQNEHKQPLACWPPEPV